VRLGRGVGAEFRPIACDGARVCYT